MPTRCFHAYGKLGESKTLNLKRVNHQTQGRMILHGLFVAGFLSYMFWPALSSAPLIGPTTLHGRSQLCRIMRRSHATTSTLSSWAIVSAGIVASSKPLQRKSIFYAVAAFDNMRPRMVQWMYLLQSGIFATQCWRHDVRL